VRYYNLLGILIAAALGCSSPVSTVEDTRLRIQETLARRGHFAPALAEIREPGVLAYAYLDTDIRFAHRFETFEDPPVLYVGGRRAQIRVDGAEPVSLSDGDVLVIPELRASFRYSCAPLEGLYLQNAGWEEFFVHGAIQDIRFAMDEGGVRVESDMALALKQKGPPVPHKVMVLHPPYLMYLKLKEGRYPFFMVWVANDELMVTGG
jgi:hypothetical protein